MNYSLMYRRIGEGGSVLTNCIIGGGGALTRFNAPKLVAIRAAFALSS